MDLSMLVGRLNAALGMMVPDGHQVDVVVSAAVTGPPRDGASHTSHLATRVPLQELAGHAEEGGVALSLDGEGDDGPFVRLRLELDESPDG